MFFFSVIGATQMRYDDDGDDDDGLSNNSNNNNNCYDISTFVNRIQR